MLENCFGDANAFVLRSAFQELGGFTEDYGSAHEDWEFFARAAIAGLRIETIPEGLYWYRIQERSMVRGDTSHSLNRLRSLSPYVNAMPDKFRYLPMMAARAQRIAHSASTRYTLEAVDQYWTSTSWRVTYPLRFISRRLQSLPPEKKPSPRSTEEAERVIDAITTSTSWEITGPLRAAGRILKRL
jgi:GT2 family glycosyltransferase